MSGTKTAIYCRISKDRAGAGLGVARQESDCRNLAERLGWDVAEVYVDNDVSAYSGRRRPAYQRMLDDIARGRATAIIAWHTDRLHRSPVELEAFITFCEQHAVEIRTVQAGEIDLATASGRMVARMLGAAARHEVEHKSERIKRAKVEKALAGRPNGGRRAFGWEPDGLTPREDEAARIRQMVDQVIAGVSLQEITRDLTASGVRTVTGKTSWRAVSVRHALLSPRHAGLAQYHGEIVGEGEWPAIVDRDKWEACRKILLSNPRTWTERSGSRVRWLGSGIYICGTCKTPLMRVTGSAKGRRIYVCRNPEKRNYVGRHVARDQVQLDEYVTATLIARLSQPDALDLFVREQDQHDVGALQLESRALAERLDGLAEMYAAGQITTAQLAAGTDKIRARQADVDAELAAAAVTDPLGALVGADDIAAAWERLPMGVQRGILQTVMTVTLLPAKPGQQPGGEYFDPDAVQIEWRQ